VTLIERLWPAFVSHLARKPHFQAKIQGKFSRCAKAVDIETADPDGIAVQVILDDLELVLDNFRIEDRTSVIPHHHTPHVVANAFSFHLVPLDEMLLSDNGTASV
jgi:hypothetical protein